MQKRVMWIAAIVVGGFVMAKGFDYLIESNGVAVSASQPAQVETGNASGEAAIGGHFELVNHKGEAVTDQNYAGKLMLVFFGFTNCPEVCPVDLMVMSKAIEQLGDDANKVAPIFITVDPERDTVEQMASYLSNFSPAIDGLTGSAEQLKAAQAAYKIFAQKIEMNSSMGVMYNHSAFTYLMGRDGKYLTHFPHNTKPEDVVVTIRKHL